MHNLNWSQINKYWKKDFTQLLTETFESRLDIDLEYEDIYFQADDGVPLEGWFIPCKGSSKLIISNHFLPGNRYGFASHLPEFSALGGFEVNFLPRYKALHDAGYNVFCYDIRNHGLSDSANGGTIGFGHFEWRDVIGSIKDANSREDTKNMTKGLLSICLGCNSTLQAMAKKPDYFDDFKYYFETWEYAKADKLPTKSLQVQKDTWTYAEDVENIYNRLGTDEKELYWITETDRGFDGYNFLGEHPEVALEWFNEYFI
ncbi:uncharacterized protein KGF55_005192 [Candida pseudojiufengensis]|uniref:uncharacterized protein n=1 Tax=Candida pseudojiufengensis TaxID=497109 RepID=UPI0022243ABA|nr:uncharacterized protein KGF55_005192 [Candida pseudojiufengensis]KAI5959960.1 hypothetical protein KGF55_005192 [Candida pseudojiufengensis]